MAHNGVGCFSSVSHTLTEEKTVVMFTGISRWQV